MIFADSNTVENADLSPLDRFGANLRWSARPWVDVFDHATLLGPIPNAQEACFYYDVAPAADGTVPVAVVHRGLGLGVYQVFQAVQLPHFMVWRMPGEGTYAVGLEPGTNFAITRAETRRQGKLIELDPGDVPAHDLEIGALNGSGEIEAFEQRVAAASGQSR